MKKQQETIIVVDDDAEMNTALNRLLQAAGYDTVSYLSAEALIEKGVSKSTACMIFDIQLPGMSGIELSRHLKHIGIDKPTVLMTAFDDPSYSNQAKDAGASTCIHKPFPGKILLTAIKEAMTIH